MRVVSVRSIAGEMVASFKEGDYSDIVPKSDRGFYASLKRGIIREALVALDGEDPISFIRKLHRVLGVPVDDHNGPFLIRCDYCGKKSEFLMELCRPDNFIWVCESCLERALGMLRGETNKGE